ncbi:hypothetical protein SLS60_002360 [Paraconiothyrium brasiliense]|uniref:Uncharacterized protein n=1 Tax=Paraconiothyrium brasiliense TaxID=300254 RepID=A0ABR3S1Y5_9PLEO
MRPQHDVGQYADGPPRLINVTGDHGSEAFPALVLSYELAEKMRSAICAGYSLCRVADTLQNVLDEQHTMKAKLRVEVLRIKRYESASNNATAAEEIENTGLRLLQAYEDQSRLQGSLNQLVEKEASLRKSKRKASRNREIRWAEIDSDLSLAFKNSGFTVEPYTPAMNTFAATSNQTKETSSPTFAVCRGYASNPVYVPREEVQAALPRLFLSAKLRIQDKREEYMAWRELFDDECKEYASARGIPFDTSTLWLKARDRFRQDYWHNHNQKLGNEKEEARKDYYRAYEAARGWGLDDLASLPSISWISTGPEEENRAAMERTNRQYVKRWINSLPDGNNMKIMPQWDMSELPTEIPGGQNLLEVGDDLDILRYQYGRPPLEFSSPEVNNNDDRHVTLTHEKLEAHRYKLGNAEYPRFSSRISCATATTHTKNEQLRANPDGQGLKSFRAGYTSLPSSAMDIEASIEDGQDNPPNTVLNPNPQPTNSHMNTPPHLRVQPHPPEVVVWQADEDLPSTPASPATPAGTYNPILQAAAELQHKKEGQVHFYVKPNATRLLLAQQSTLEEPHIHNTTKARNTSNEGLSETNINLSKVAKKDIGQVPAMIEQNDLGHEVTAPQVNACPNDAALPPCGGSQVETGGTRRCDTQAFRAIPGPHSIANNQPMLKRKLARSTDDSPRVKKTPRTKAESSNPRNRAPQSRHIKRIRQATPKHKPYASSPVSYTYMQGFSSQPMIVTAQLPSCGDFNNPFVYSDEDDDH